MVAELCFQAHAHTLVPWLVSSSRQVRQQFPLSTPAHPPRRWATGPRWKVSSLAPSCTTTAPRACASSWRPSPPASSLGDSGPRPAARPAHLRAGQDQHHRGAGAQTPADRQAPLAGASKTAMQCEEGGRGGPLPAVSPPLLRRATSCPQQAHAHEPRPLLPPPPHCDARAPGQRGGGATRGQHE